MRYNELHDDLILSDIEELRGHKGPEDAPGNKSFFSSIQL